MRKEGPSVILKTIPVRKSTGDFGVSVTKNINIILTRMYTIRLVIKVEGPETFDG